MIVQVTELVRAIREVRAFAVDDTLSVVQFATTAGQPSLTLVATDRYRLIVARVASEKAAAADVRCNVDAQAALSCAELLDAHTATHVRVDVNPESVLVRLEDELLAANMGLLVARPTTDVLSVMQTVERSMGESGCHVLLPGGDALRTLVQSIPARQRRATEMHAPVMLDLTVTESGRLMGVWSTPAARTRVQKEATPLSSVAGMGVVHIPVLRGDLPADLCLTFNVHLISATLLVAAAHSGVSVEAWLPHAVTPNRPLVLTTPGVAVMCMPIRSHEASNMALQLESALLLA